MAKALNILYLLFISSRPRQWLKNLSIFAALFFSGRLLIQNDFINVVIVFFIFCLLSSSIYLINDVADIQADRVHFSKKNRPLAAGLISKEVALFTAFLLAFLGMILAFNVSKIVLLVAAVFLIIQVLYSLTLKKILIIDVMTIAFLFILRVFIFSF